MGEASIIVAASSVHRKEANAATSRIMDVVKERVPVWKREVYSDGVYCVSCMIFVLED